MRINITPTGYEITKDGGEWLVSQCGDSRYWQKLNERNKPVDTYEYRIVYDESGNTIRRMSTDGGYEQFVYDPYRNPIAEYSTRPFSRRARVTTYSYTRIRSGKVVSRSIGRKDYDTYLEWAAAIPDTFEVTDEVEPTTYKAADIWGGYDGPVLSTERLNEVYSQLVREDARQTARREPARWIYTPDEIDLYAMPTPAVWGPL